jgi:hypothetical protein
MIKIDELAGCDDALIHESLILFLNSPIYTIEEKYAYVGKYLCGLQLFYKTPYCSHDTIVKNGTSNYFERKKHECHNKFDDPLYLPKFSKMHDSNSHFIKISSSNCDYYEKGGYECPLYDTKNYKLHLPIVDMHSYTLIGCDSFMYKISMHRKKVRLRYYLLHTLWCALLCFKLLNMFIDMITPWDPSILLTHIISNNKKAQSRRITHTTSLPLLKRYENPSKMAIKKCFLGGNTVIFLLDFIFALLILQESFCFVFLL